MSKISRFDAMSARQAIRRTLALESLEDRTMLSTCHVTRLSDSGAGRGFRGDLRYCINKANGVAGPDAIDIKVNGTVSLNSALPELASDIGIRGPGADLLAVRRNEGAYYRIFTVAPGATVRISGLTLINDLGYDSPGGGIDNFGTLTVAHSIIKFGFANAGGGGIFNSGTLTVESSLILSNTTAGSKDGGGIYNIGQLTVRNSTIANNSGGGGIANGAGIFNNGFLTVSHSTIAGNSNGSSSTSGGDGAGIFNGSNGTAVLTHSTVSDNSSGGNGGGGIHNAGLANASRHCRYK